MALFGDERDIAFINSINDEFLREIVEQEVLYYKLNLKFTDNNIYGESKEKFYNEPILLNLLVMRDDQQQSDKPYGSDTNRLNQFRFFKRHLEEAQIYGEKGDIIEWGNEFYEVDNIIENQLFMGKSNNTQIEPHLTGFGSSISVIMSGKLIRPDKLNIINVRD